MLFPKKEVFVGSFRGWVDKNKKSSYSAAHSGNERKISQEKQKQDILKRRHDGTLLFAILCFPGGLSSEWIFQRTAVDDCSRYYIIVIPIIDHFKCLCERKLVQDQHYSSSLLVHL